MNGKGVLVVATALLLAAPALATAQDGESSTLPLMVSSNDGLRAQGMDYMIQQIDFFGRDGVRTSTRIHRKEFRWVAGDARRGARGKMLTYLIDERATLTGDHSVEAVAAAIDRAAATWSSDDCLGGSKLARVPWDGGDTTVFDFLLEVGPFGDPFAADVTVAGFTPELAEFFGDDTIAFAVTFIFVGADGEPTDVNGDGHLDTALNEIYFNPSVDWSLDAELGEVGSGWFDIETTALHELGHALGLGHMGVPPEGAMNPVYDGVRREIGKIDHAGLCLVFSRH